MTACVVDTNVAIAANGRDTHAGPKCQLACVAKLREIVEHGFVVIDAGGRILKEYRDYLNPSGQPGVGDAFFRHVFQNQVNRRRCEVVPITVRDGDTPDFDQFPRDPDLAGFDPSDRKFVAVALGSRRRPVIENATDTDWWEAREALRRNGVRLNFLCLDLMRRRN